MVKLDLSALDTDDVNAQITVHASSKDRAHVHYDVDVRGWVATLEGYDGAPDNDTIYGIVGMGDTPREAYDGLIDSILG